MIIVVGQGGSGKTTAREYLETRGFMGAEASVTVKRIMLELGVESVDELLATCPAAVAAERVYGDLERTGTDPDRWVVSGFRLAEEVDYMRSRTDTTVVAIRAPVWLCYERTRSRERSDDPLSFAAFWTRKIEADRGLGLQGVIDSADRTVQNAASIEEFYCALEDIIRGS